MKKYFVFLLLLSAVLSTAGCDTLKRQVGLTRRSPDEFAVMRRAPLAIPQNLNQVSSLPTPQPGAARPQETSPETDAQLAILGAPSGQSTGYAISPGEASLLQKAGAAQTDPNIRATINQEATQESKDNRPVVKRLLNIGNGTQPATLVDPKAEAQRLKDNRQKGQPVTSGETPTVDD